MSTRQDKINDLIRDEVGRIISRDVDLPAGVLSTVVGVETSRTLEHASVYISAVPDAKADEIIRILTKDIYSIQKALNKKLIMRPIPKIRFVHDQGEEHAQKIEKLLDSM